MAPVTEAELCPCGRPLHYTNPKDEAAVKDLVERLGELQPVHTPYGSAMVPRHYIALHGLYAPELPLLKKRYGWD